MPTIRGEKVDVEVEDLGYKLRFRIGTRRHWGMYAGIAIVLAVMIPGTWFAISLLTGTGPVEALPVSGARMVAVFAVAFGIGWGLMALVVGSLLVQMLFGYEQIEVGSGKLISSVKPIGFPRTYSSLEISDLRLDRTIPEGLARGDYDGWDSPPLPVTPITFAASGRTAQIGKTMYEPEAAQVLAMIGERMGLAGREAGDDARNAQRRTAGRDAVAADRGRARAHVPPRGL